ncbi:hypothetical protein KY343_03635 [Candidatus Woesearchaeota archaeon]|nr:hypothetical protein [Candidatus Woesearchaeota archaeon]
MKIGKVILYQQSKIKEEIPLRLKYEQINGKEYYLISFNMKDSFLTSMTILFKRYNGDIIFDFKIDVDNRRAGLSMERLESFIRVKKEDIRKIIDLVKKINEEKPIRTGLNIEFNKYINIEKITRKVKNDKAAEEL